MCETQVVMSGWVVQVWRTKRRRVRKRERGVRLLSDDMVVVWKISFFMELELADRFRPSCARCNARLYF